MTSITEEDNIVDLNIGKATVGSIVSRLSRWEKDIENITVIIDWKSGHTNVASNFCGAEVKAYHAMVLQKEVMEQMDE